MLTRVYIDNFRSFQNFEFKPAKKQLLLGTNGSGKTSLLEAVRRLKDFVNGNSNVFSQSTRTRWADNSAQVFEIEARLDEKRFEYRLELGYRGTTKELTVALERLTVEGETVFQLAEGKIRFFPSTSESVAVPLQTNRSSLSLSVLSNNDVRRFVEWLSDHVHCFDIDPYPGQMDETADSEEREPDFEMNNLAGGIALLSRPIPPRMLNLSNQLGTVWTGFRRSSFRPRTMTCESFGQSSPPPRRRPSIIPSRNYLRASAA